MWPFSRNRKEIQTAPAHRPVPPIQMYYPSVGAMTPQQRAFYKHWRKQFEQGLAIDIGENISYAFCYCYEIQASTDLRLIHKSMRDLATAYPGKIGDYCGDWAIDALIGQGSLDQALREFPPLPLNRSGSLRTDVLLSLKLRLDQPIAGRDLLTLNGPKVTKYARDHLVEIAQYLDADLQARQAHGETLSKWVRAYHIGKANHHLFNGSLAGRATDKLETHWFSRSQEMLDFCSEATREAENTLREERGVPHVGEGWVAETELFFISSSQRFPTIRSSIMPALNGSAASTWMSTSTRRVWRLSTRARSTTLRSHILAARRLFVSRSNETNGSYRHANAMASTCFTSMRGIPSRT